MIADDKVTYCLLNAGSIALRRWSHSLLLVRVTRPSPRNLSSKRINLILWTVMKMESLLRQNIFNVRCNYPWWMVSSIWKWFRINLIVMKDFSAIIRYMMSLKPKDILLHLDSMLTQQTLGCTFHGIVCSVVIVTRLSYKVSCKTPDSRNPKNANHNFKEYAKPQCFPL